MLSVWEERKVRLYGEHANVHQSHSQIDSGDLRGVAGGVFQGTVHRDPLGWVYLQHLAQQISTLID